MKDYDCKKPSNVICYLDMNNLYRWVMNGLLPYKGFTWVKDVDEFDIFC